MDGLFLVVKEKCSNCFSPINRKIPVFFSHYPYVWKSSHLFCLKNESWLGFQLYSTSGS